MIRADTICIRNMLFWRQTRPLTTSVCSLVSFISYIRTAMNHYCAEN